jgi:hypothetical protein
MKALIISLESFQKGEIPQEVQDYIASCEVEPFIILDESSKIKTNNPCKDSKKSKRTQAVLKLNRTGERCILTGTFMSKTPVNAYDQMNFLCPDFFPESMYAFAEHHEIRRTLKNVRGARTLLSPKDYESIRNRLVRYKDDPSRFGNVAEGVRAFYGISFDDCIHIVKHEAYTPFKHLDELWKRIGDNVIKVDRKTSMPDLPPKLYKEANVELTAEQKKLYLQLQSLHCTDDITVDNGLKLYLRFQDICNGYNPVEYETEENGEMVTKVELVPLAENPKIDMLEEAVEQIGDKQIVVWCSRTQLLYDAKKRLEEAGYICGAYDGVNKDRESDYQGFADKCVQIMLCNQASAGYGLDKFQNADYAIYLCNSYSVEQRVQSENRIDRGATTRSKYFIDITCKGTVEERVNKALLLGQELLDTGTTDTSLFVLDENA